MVSQALRSRVKLPLYSAVSLAGLSVFAIAVFSSIDSAGLFESLPPAFDNLIGGTAGGNYVVSEIFGLIAPVLILVIAISGGVAAVAGEERDHTASLLLAQPVLRRDVVIAKSAALSLHLLLAVAIFLAGFMIGSAVFDSGITAGNAAATTLHLLSLGLAFAMVALAFSAWTGSASLSLAAASAIAVLADLMASMLPLVSGLEGVAKASPWYYYNGSAPLANGINFTHLAVLLSIAAVSFVLALVGVRRRDIEAGRSRALSIPAISLLTRARVNSVFVKSLTERFTMISVAGAAMALMAIAVALMFSGLESTLRDFSKQIPESLASLYGSADLGTPVGWIDAELYSIMVPGLLVAVSIVLGVSAIAGEQKQQTLGLLLATPISRRRLMLEKAAALTVVVSLIAVLIGVGVLAGSALAGLGLSAVDVAAVTTHGILLALFFGSVALAAGAVFDARAATRVSVTAAFVAYMAQAFLPNSDALSGLAKLSPWHYYSASGPLANGFDALHLLVLAALTAGVLGAALALVNRRDVG
jgi:ABC-2 type transport system permease protein